MSFRPSARQAPSNIRPAMRHPAGVRTTYCHRKTMPATGKKQDRKPVQSYLFDECTPDESAIVVDGSCIMQTGVFEFQAVWLSDRRSAFQSPVLHNGTNNIAEFLGIVSALKHIKELGLDCPVYSDSQVAISWVRKRVHKSAARLTREVQDLLDDAIQWLEANPNHAAVYQWKTREWGENPADYGRK